MKMNETVAGLTVTAKTEGVDQAKKQVDALTQSTQQLGVVAEQSSKGAISLETQWKRATLRFDEAARAQANIERETTLANKAVAQGVATQQQANEHLARVAQRYTELGKGGERAAKGTGLARHELINLGRQAQDVGVSLASGQSPLMVLVQQGTQIADVFATSGGTLRGFFSQAIGWGKQFLMSTGGIVTAVLAIGGAAIYAASQFVKASTTIEQALEEQNRLLKEGKALIDARTSAEAKAQAQAKDLTQFEMTRNLLDLQIKLNAAQEEALRIASARATTPTGGGMPEMGIAPTGAAAIPGYESIAAAVEKLKAAQASGLPGLKEFNAELGRIGSVHPELAQVVEDMIKAGRAGMELEHAALKARAMSDALKGIATDAQLAAVGLGSVAQHQLNSRQANEAREATERQAQAVLEMARAYPGMSIEAAKQLNAAENQLRIAQESTGIGQIIAQHEATINSLKLQGLTLSEATAIADKQRAISVARVNAAIDEQIHSLEQSTELLNTRSKGAENAVKAEHAYQNALRAGASEFKAEQLREATIANQIAQENKEAAAAAEERVRAYRNAAIAAQNEAASVNAIAKAAYNANLELMKFVPTIAQSLGGQLYQSKQGGYSQFNPAGYTSSWKNEGYYAAQDQYGPGGFDEETLAPNAQGLEYAFNKSGGMGSGSIMESPRYVYTGGDPAWMASGQVDTAKLGLAQRAIELLPQEQQVAPLQQLIKQLESAPYSLAGQEAIQSLTEKIEQLTQATETNTNATSAMTDVLSPFYSQDPRRTHLGFRAFAGGGIMTQYGELPLRHYQSGGMATSPQVAVFGEGSTPEAYVPVPSGRIPVELKMPANSNRPVVVNINVMGNANAETVTALKQTSFQKAQQLRRITG